jgi:hypothetical protein
MFVYEARRVLSLQRFFASVWMWDKRFSPHAQHGVMLEGFGCGFEGMHRLLFSP